MSQAKGDKTENSILQPVNIYFPCIAANLLILYLFINFSFLAFSIMQAEIYNHIFYVSDAMKYAFNLRNTKFCIYVFKYFI